MRRRRTDRDHEDALRTSGIVAAAMGATIGGLMVLVLLHGALADAGLLGASAPARPWIRLPAAIACVAYVVSHVLALRKIDRASAATVASVLTLIATLAAADVIALAAGLAWWGQALIVLVAVPPATRLAFGVVEEAVDPVGGDGDDQDGGGA